MKYLLLTFITLSGLFAQVNSKSLQKMANEELDKIKADLTQEIIDSSAISDVEVPILMEEVNIPSKKVPIKNKPFGHSFFESDINFFDNIPTPVDYLLGPGDEIILSIWGDTNLRSVFTINKNGLIYFENIGLINISNKSIIEAEEFLKVKLLSVYSTLGTSSNLNIELSKIKSLNIFFTGEFNNPGISLIHPFSSPLTAIIQAGGITENASIRNIQVFRNNKLLTTIDFYDFLLSGNKERVNIKLIDGDTIHVPVIKNKVELIGELNRPGDYEFLNNESLKELLQIAGGLKATAANKAIVRQIDPIEKRSSDDFAMKGEIVHLENSSSTFIGNGAIVKIPQISKNITDVQVFGRVNFPGSYPVNSETTLKDILDLSGGFDDPFFRKTIRDEITVLRLNESNYNSTEIQVSYKNSEKFQILAGDKILVYEDINYQQSLVYEIGGEINIPGTYSFTAGISLADAISKAGGVTELGQLNNITIEKNLLTDFENSEEPTMTKESISNITMDYKLEPNDRITVKKKTNVISVIGNVYNGGFIAIGDRKSVSFGRAIELAGGYKPSSLKRKSYVIRSNQSISKPSFFSRQLLRVYPGDQIVVPMNENADKFDFNSFIADLSTTLANIAAILIIVDNQKTN